jgi:hypothetical protein
MFHFLPWARLSYIIMLYSVRPTRKLEGPTFGQESSEPSTQPLKVKEPCLDPEKI